MLGRSLAVSTLAVCLAACSTSPRPEPGIFSDDVTFFESGGFTFAARIQDGELLVKVPCCQTYDADEDFRALMLEAIEERLGCTPLAPVFTDGWIGEWQLRTPYACFNGSSLDSLQIADADAPPLG